MSCHLSKRACIVNLKTVKSSLNFIDETEPEPYSIESWNSGWDDEAASKSTDCQTTGKYEGSLWLQECITSLSPTLDSLALAYKEHAVFLLSKWDVNEENNVKLKFFTSFEGSLSVEKNEIVTSLLCLPLASQKKTSQGGPDWTCMIVGFSSGFVRFYTEKAELLLSQLLHDEPVNHLKCQTHAPQHFANHTDQPEELIIIYASVVVTIDGFGLFQTLRACRNQLARATAGKQDISQPPPLSYKKWAFQDHKFSDCEAAGTVTLSTFDHLVTESIRKGFYGPVKPNVPSSSFLLTTGMNPYVGFYHATEGNNQLLLTDVVHAVASRFLNFIAHPNAGGFIGGLIGRNEPDPVKTKPKIEPPTVLPLRFGLYDKRRQGLSTVLSPNKLLCTIADAFGRVILFDVVKGISVRMWKGYRDAQCGWIEVEDDIQSKDSTMLNFGKRKRVFFLAIYAPRRGILEVWCAQQGPRVAAFNVGKSGRLLSPGYSMAGGHFSNPSLSKSHLSSCYFLDTDGFLKKVSVPFHLALSERNSKRVRDLHLLKELKVLLKNMTKEKAIDVIKILKDMRTSNIRIQALDSLFSNRHSTADVVDYVVTGLLTHLQKQDPVETDYEMKVLMQCCLRASQLVKLYKVMNENINLKSNSESKSDSSLNVQLYATTLCISEVEVGRALSFVTLHQKVAPVVKKQVRFLDVSVTDLPFYEFMAFFNVTDCNLQKTGDFAATANLKIDLKSNLSEKQMESLGGFLFHTSVYFGSSFSSLQIALKTCGILPEKLLLLLLAYWVSDSSFCEDIEKWTNLQQAMKHISSLRDPKVICSESDHVSPWWKAVRDVLLQSVSNLSSYVAAIVARSVSVILASAFHEEMRNAAGKTKPLKEDAEGETAAENDDSDWEAISLDLEHWNILVKQLEDVLLLSILLNSQPFGKFSSKDVNISIQSLLNGGQGTVTDLVAVWAVCAGFQSDLLSSLFIKENCDDISIAEKFLVDDKIDVQNMTMIKGIINELRKKFPYSLNHDVLLSNCSWEHLMQWNKNKDEVEHLNQALGCFNLVNSSVIKNGFAAMMWKSCIQKKFEALAHLIEKVGKTPKERLCRKELEMNDSRLENFLNFCCQLLTIILETTLAPDMEEIPKYMSEQFWQDHESQGPTPLVLMALGQKVSVNNSVYQHLMLSTVLHLIVTFQMKNSRPLGLFGVTTRKAFFRELHYNRNIISEKEEASLENQRLQFLQRAVAAIAQSIPETVPEALQTPVFSHPDDADKLCGNEGRRLASKWFNKVIDLGRDWELNLDELRRHYICELYSGGHDSIAREVMATVSEKALLGSQLLLLCGQRLNILVYESTDTANRLGCLSPDLSTWIQSLSDKKLRSNNVPLPATINLANHILGVLPEGEREFELAQSVQDSLKSLSLICEKQVS